MTAAVAVETEPIPSTELERLEIAAPRAGLEVQRVGAKDVREGEPEVDFRCLVPRVVLIAVQRDRPLAFANARSAGGELDAKRRRPLVPNTTRVAAEWRDSTALGGPSLPSLGGAHSILYFVSRDPPISDSDWFEDLGRAPRTATTTYL